VPVSAIPRDTAALRFRQVLVRGTPDFDHEILLTHRGRDGAPGVDILTPVRISGRDTAVIVNRGWVYSPDGMTIEPSRWRESTTTFVGYVDVFEAGSRDSVRERKVRRASYAAVSRALPYPVAPFYVVALDELADSAPSGQRVIRLGRPKLDAGPHLSYAFQWFGFATIALIGAGIVAARSMHKPSS
jgi:surfeit locus 1 family protein